MTPNDSLFDYAPGTDTDTFALGEWPLGQNPEVCKISEPPLGTPETGAQEPLNGQVAAQLCAGVVDTERRIHCTQDVKVTGEPAFAQAYLDAEVRSLNEPPASPLLISPPEVEDTFSLPLDLVWKPGEETQEEIVYRLCVWASGERFTFDQCVEVDEPVVSWPDVFYPQGSNFDPQSGDVYFWKVLAEDELGATSESETWRFELN